MNRESDLPTETFHDSSRESRWWQTPPVSICIDRPATEPASEPLDRKLRMVISNISDSIRMSKMIALNISLLAARDANNFEENNAAIQVVAREIQRLSNESDSNVDQLRSVLAGVKLLTRTINLAGRQRMLSQKIMKHFLIQAVRPTSGNSEAMRQLMSEFESALLTLRRCELNTPDIVAQIGRVQERWKTFVVALNNADTDAAIQLNELVLADVQQVVQHYEALAGTAN